MSAETEQVPAEVEPTSTLLPPSPEPTVSDESSKPANEGAEPTATTTTTTSTTTATEEVKGAEPAAVVASAEDTSPTTPTTTTTTTTTATAAAAATPHHNLPPAPTAEDVPDEDETSGQGRVFIQNEQMQSLAASTPVPTSPSPLSPATLTSESQNSKVPVPASNDNTLEATDGKPKDADQAAAPSVSSSTVSEAGNTTEAEAADELSPPVPFVRPYDSTKDYHVCQDICLKTVGPSLRSLLSSPYKTLIPATYCRPYLLFSSSTCFVLDDGCGTAVGYIIGTPSTRRFIQSYKSDYLPLLDVYFPSPHTKILSELGDSRKWLLDVLFDPEKGMMVKEFDGEYDAHFHIDILEGWQGKGWGVKLLKMWEEAAKRLGKRLRGQKEVDGVFVGVDPENERAVKWYERNGFVKREVEKGGLWLVKKL